MKIKKLISVLYEIGIMFWVMANVIILMNAPEWYAKYKYPDLSKTVVEVHLSQAQISSVYGPGGSPLTGVSIKSGNQTFVAQTVPTELWDHFRLRYKERDYVLHAKDVNLLILNHANFYTTVKSISFNEQTYVISDRKVSDWLETSSPYVNYSSATSKPIGMVYMVIWTLMIIGSAVFLKFRMWRLFKFPKKGKPTSDNQAQ